MTSTRKRDTLGARLRRLREARGLTWVALAEAAHLTPDTLYRIARGEIASPGLDAACALADALGVTLDQLAGRAPIE